MSLTPENAADIAAARNTDGTFGEQNTNLPDVALPGVTYERTGYWEPASDTWEQDVADALEAFGEHTSVEDSVYENGIKVSTRNGGEYLLISRDHAIDNVYNDITDGEAGGNVPAWLLAEQSGISESVFDLIQQQEDDGSIGLDIISVLQATNSTRKVAETIVDRPHDATIWFGAQPGNIGDVRDLTNRNKGRNLLAFRSN